MTIAQEATRMDPANRGKTPDSPAHEAARHFTCGANPGNNLEAPKVARLRAICADTDS